MVGILAAGKTLPPPDWSENDTWWEKILTADHFLNTTKGRLLIVLGFILGWSFLMMFLMESPPPSTFRNNAAYHMEKNIHDKKADTVEAEKNAEKSTHDKKSD
jgi:hypothetical protein